MIWRNILGPPDKTKGILSRPLPLLLLIVLLGGVLRLSLLGSQALWFDELYSIYSATIGGGPSHLWSNWRNDTQSPWSYCLLWAWLKAMPVTEFTVRLIPAMAGLLTLPLFYRLVAESFGRRAGLIGIFILSISPLHVHYSQEARSYALSVLLSTSSLLFIWRALTQKSGIWWIWYVMSASLLVWMHPFNALVIVGQMLGATFLLAWSRSSAIPFLMSTGVLLFASAMPVLMSLPVFQRIDQTTIIPLSMPSLLMTLSVGEARYAPELPRWLALLVFSLFVTLGLATALSHRRTAAILNTAGLVTPLFLVGSAAPALGHALPSYGERLFIATLPMFIGLVGAGAERVLVWRPPWGARIAVVLLVVVSLADAVALANYHSGFVKNVDKTVLDYVKLNAQPGDLILSNSYSMDLTLDHYGSRDLPHLGSAMKAGNDWRFSEISSVLASIERMEQRWNWTMRDLSVYKRIWLIYAEGQGSPSLIDEMMHHHRLVLHRTFGPFTLYLLQVPGSE